MSYKEIEEGFKTDFIDAIEIRRQELLDRLKLNYALYTSVEEKNKVSISLLAETRDKLSKYEGYFAEFIRAGILEKEIFHLGDQNLVSIVTNFINGHIEDSFWNSFQEDEEINFDTVLNSHPEKEVLHEFIDAFAYVGLFEYLNWSIEYQKEEGFEFDRTKRIRKSSFLNFNDGRMLNLLERYYLLDELTGIGKVILQLPSKKREELLSHLLSCNPKNSQQIINGTYDGKFRKDELDKFLEEIKKE